MKRYALLLLIALSACSTIDSAYDSVFTRKPKAKATGERIAVLSDIAHVKPDDSLKDIAVTIPEANANAAWPQTAGSTGGLTGNLQLTGLSHRDSASVGEGHGWEQPLYPSPIVANGLVFAMDARGYVTAQDIGTIDKIRWSSKAPTEKDESDLLGGGLAFDNGAIYVTSGRGRIFALDAATGTQRWKTSIGVPLRSAPKVANGQVYALSVDNQLFAFKADNGAQLWSHRGISENTEFLAAISPAISETTILVPYSSGELHALDLATGQEIWSDTLLVARRTTATGGFSGIGGNPIVEGDMVYAPGSSGVMAAMSLATGRRVWEQDISSLNTPWIAGDYIYVLSSDSELICLNRADGRVKWVSTLPRFEDEAKKKNALVWRGPIMAGWQLLVAGMHGEMWSFNPLDGTKIAKIEIPAGLTNTPIVAGGRLYMLTADAKLHTLY